MATPSISYLALDSSYDPIFADGTSLTGAQAVAQAILTRLKLFLGEWWEDLNLGLPVFQQMLGQLGSQKGLAAIDLAIRTNIEGAPFVSNVIDVQTSFVDGNFSFTATAQTVFGVVTVSNTPGSSASLD